MPASPRSAKRKEAKPLYKLSKSPRIGRLGIVNHFKSAVSKLAPTTNHPAFKLFLSSYVWPWIWNYVKHLGPKCSFPTYDGKTKNGVYRIVPASRSKSIQIAI